MDWFHLELESGNPIVYGQQRITLRTLIAWLRIPIPFSRYMVYFNRPIAVEVQAGSGPVQRQLVFNRTRLAVIGIYLLAMISSIIIWRVSNVRK